MPIPGQLSQILGQPALSCYNIFVIRAIEGLKNSPQWWTLLAPSGLQTRHEHPDGVELAFFIRVMKSVAARHDGG